MTSAVVVHPTCCPRCDAPFVYRLDVNEGAGGGLRYDVSCPPCGETYFEMCTPTVNYLPAPASGAGLLALASRLDCGA